MSEANMQKSLKAIIRQNVAYYALRKCGRRAREEKGVEIVVKLTDYLAVWGALVATLVAAWSIYKDLIRRDRIVVSAGFRKIYPPGQDVFAFYITNLTSHKVKVTHCGSFAKRRVHPRLLAKLVKPWYADPESGYLFRFVP